MWDYLFGAIALMFVIEGVLPFLCPECWRAWVAKMLRCSDQTMRLVGFSMMLGGVVLLYFVNYFCGEW
jgi:uncharacterized protein